MKIPPRMICELSARFSGKRIICKPPKNPEEVICEIAREPNGLWSVATALIAESRPHYHKITAEVYVLQKGRLKLFRQASTQRFLSQSLRVNRPVVILPGMVHWAEASELAEVLVIATPAWSAADHFLVTLPDCC